MPCLQGLRGGHHKFSNATARQKRQIGCFNRLPPGADLKACFSKTLLFDRQVTMEGAAKQKNPIETAESREERQRLAEAEKTYGRGKQVNTKNVKDKKLRGNLKVLENKYKDATLKAKDAEILLENEGGFLEPEGELERTYKVRQDDIKASVGIEAAKSGFELRLDELGPYAADYTRNGRKLLLAGRKGHVATMDWREGKLGCELQLGETVRDAKWLHNDQYFAVAQKKYLYIYDRVGLEIHCLTKHVEPTHIEFLPYHFLLASVVRCIFCLFYPSDCVANKPCFTVNELVSQVHRYVHRPADCRNSNPPGGPYILVSKPSQRYPACRPPEWHRDAMVAELDHSPRQSARSPGSCAVARR